MSEGSEVQGQDEEITPQDIRDEIRCQGTKIRSAIESQTDHQALTLGLTAALLITLGAVSAVPFAGSYPLLVVVLGVGAVGMVILTCILAWYRRSRRQV